MFRLLNKDLQPVVACHQNMYKDASSILHRSQYAAVEAIMTQFNNLGANLSMDNPVDTSAILYAFHPRVLIAEFKGPNTEKTETLSFIFEWCQKNKGELSNLKVGITEHDKQETKLAYYEKYLKPSEEFNDFLPILYFSQFLEPYGQILKASSKLSPEVIARMDKKLQEEAQTLIMPFYEACHGILMTFAGLGTTHGSGLGPLLCELGVADTFNKFLRENYHQDLTTFHNNIHKGTGIPLMLEPKDKTFRQ